MDNQDDLNLLRKINKKKYSSQRELAKELNFSLGKLNYCLKALKNKGLIKINNFKNNPNKFNYVYVLTPKGIAVKTKMNISLMKIIKKIEDGFKKEIENDKDN